MTIENVADAAELKELADYRTAIEASSKEIEAMKQEKSKRDFNDAMRNLVGSPGDWVSQSARNAAIELMTKSGDLVLENGRLTVIDGQGGLVVGSNGLMSSTEYLEKFRSDNPWFVKSAGHQVTASEDPKTSDTHLRRLFGKHSEGKYANTFANQFPAEYKRLKVLAKEQGLV